MYNNVLDTEPGVNSVFQSQKDMMYNDHKQILQIIFSDFSDSEAMEDEYMAELQKQEPRRSSLEDNMGKSTPDKDRKKPPYRRSHSLAEIRRPTHVFLPEGSC